MLGKWQGRARQGKASLSHSHMHRPAGLSLSLSLSVGVQFAFLRRGYCKVSKQSKRVLGISSHSTFYETLSKGNVVLVAILPTP